MAEFLHVLTGRPVFLAALFFHILYRWAMRHHNGDLDSDNSYSLMVMYLCFVWIPFISLLTYSYHELTSSSVTQVCFQWLLKLVLCKLSCDLSIANPVSSPHLYWPGSRCWPGHSWVPLLPDILFFHITTLGPSSSSFCCLPHVSTPSAIRISPTGSSHSALFSV